MVGKQKEWANDAHASTTLIDPCMFIVAACRSDVMQCYIEYKANFGGEH